MALRRPAAGSGLLGRVHLGLVLLAAALLAVAHLRPTLAHPAPRGIGWPTGRTAAVRPAAVGRDSAGRAQALPSPALPGMVDDQHVWFIRHGQAEHNVRRRYHLPDPPLTPLGR
eukprot:EG_transcript_55240